MTDDKPDHPKPTDQPVRDAEARLRAEDIPLNGPVAELALAAIDHLALIESLGKSVKRDGKK